MYYLPWEFTSGGHSLFTPGSRFCRTRSPVIVVAIMIQTFLSTIYHIGHPSSEVFGAFLMGLISGSGHRRTGSFLYALFHHALIGILNDCITYGGLRRIATPRKRNRLMQ